MDLENKISTLPLYQTSVTPRESNNFDSIRIIAAAAVIFSHAFLITSGTQNYEPLSNLTRGRTTIGTVAVILFFAISGYLITRSYDRSRNALKFMLARTLRILPALFVVLTITILVVGPLYTSLPLGDYLKNAETRNYLLKNLLFITKYELPGVFHGLQYPKALNVSLWTLRPEVYCYIIVLILGYVRMLKGVLFLLITVCCLMLVYFGISSFTKWLFIISPFFVGAVVYLWRVPLKGWVAIIALILFIVSLFTKEYVLIAPFALSYIVLFMSLSPSIQLPKLAKFGDISYGLYIWAFLVQQLVSSVTGMYGSWWINFLISFPITVVLAYLSWHLIERPSLGFKLKL